MRWLATLATLLALPAWAGDGLWRPPNSWEVDNALEAAAELRRAEVRPEQIAPTVELLRRCERAQREWYLAESDAQRADAVCAVIVAYLGGDDAAIEEVREALEQAEVQVLERWKAAKRARAEAVRGVLARLEEWQVRIVGEPPARRWARQVLDMCAHFAEAGKEAFVKRLADIRRELIEQFGSKAGAQLEGELEAFFGRLASMTGEQIAAESATLEAQLFDILQGHRLPSMEDFRRYAARRLEWYLFNPVMLRALILWAEQAEGR